MEHKNTAFCDASKALISPLRSRTPGFASKNSKSDISNESGEGEVRDHRIFTRRQGLAGLKSYVSLGKIDGSF
jgi:hypothetical protein